MKKLFTTLALLVSFSSMAQTCHFYQEILYKTKKGYQVAQATNFETFDVKTGNYITGNGTIYDANCVQQGNYTGLLGMWQEVEVCYNVVAQSNKLFWYTDTGVRGYFEPASQVGYPQGTMYSEKAEKSNFTAFFPIGKNYYLGLTLMHCK